MADESAWREIKLDDGPRGLRGAMAAGPRRWMQIKIDLVSKDAELRSFEYFYAPENLAPRVSEVNFEVPTLTEKTMRSQRRAPP